MPLNRKPSQVAHVLMPLVRKLLSPGTSSHRLLEPVATMIVCVLMRFMPSDRSVYMKVE